MLPVGLLKPWRLQVVSDSRRQSSLIMIMPAIWQGQRALNRAGKGGEQLVRRRVKVSKMNHSGETVVNGARCTHKLASASRNGGYGMSAEGACGEIKTEETGGELNKELIPRVQKGIHYASRHQGRLQLTRWTGASGGNWNAFDNELDA